MIVPSCSFAFVFKSMWRPAEGRFEALEPYVVETALHTSDEREGYLGYVAGTQDTIINEIGAWAQDLSSPPILCLTGPVGAGKTIITKEVASKVWFRAHLAGELFFWRGSKVRRELVMFATTIAYHLGFIIPSAAEVIQSTLSGNATILQAPVEEQWEALIVKPLKTLAGKPMTFHPCFIIDGLDACTSRDDQEWVVGKMVELCSRFPVACILSSRPELQLKTEITRCQKMFPSLFHSVIELGYNSAVQMQMRRLLHSISLTLDGAKRDPNWTPSVPLEEPFEQIIAGTDGQYIIIFCIQAYFRRQDVFKRDRHKHIQWLLDNEKVQATAFLQLDKRYDTLMSSAQSHLTEDQSILRDRILYYLLYIQPDSIHAISIFWDASPTEIRAVLGKYHSVIHVPDSNYHNLSLATRSFGNFLSSRYRGGKDAKHHISKSSLALDAFERSLYLAEHPGFHRTVDAPAHLFSLWLKLSPRVDLSAMEPQWRAKQRILRVLSFFDFSKWTAQWYRDHRNDEAEANYREFRAWLRNISKRALRKFVENGLSTTEEQAPGGGDHLVDVMRLLKLMVPKWVYRTYVRVRR
ncbi:hypothetical protein AX16_010248 [Volvariella volvacea WC 439]|nr:hypothetical protein AX16_010248 [Volvariella volvacea WC 439]